MILRVNLIHRTAKHIISSLVPIQCKYLICNFNIILLKKTKCTPNEAKDLGVGVKPLQKVMNPTNNVVATRGLTATKHNTDA